MSFNTAQMNPPPRGEFYATVTGDVEAGLAGQAAFGVKTNEDGRQILALVLRMGLGDGGEHTVICSNAMSRAPDAGRYGFGDMGPRTFVGIYSHTTADGTTGSYAAGSGTLEITDSGPVHLQGAFELSGEGENNFDMWAVEGAIQVFGVFNAARVADPFSIAFPA